MVTHTLNSYSAFIPSKVHTHSSEHTHTQQWTHTRSSGQPVMLHHPGSSSVSCSRASLVVLRVKRALNIHSPTDNPFRSWDSNLQPFDSLTIRPQLVCWHMFKRHHFTDLMYWYTCSYLQPTVTSCVFNSWLALYVLLENQISEA